MKRGKFILLSRKCISQEGFSLIEMLFAIMLLSMLSIAVTSTMLGLRKSYTTQAVASDAQQSARVGLDYMVREIRMAGLDPILDTFGEGVAGAGIVNAGSSTLRFTRDMLDDATGQANGMIDMDRREQVTFFYNSGTRQLQEILYQGTGSQDTQTLLEDVSSVRFSYLNQDGNEIASPNSNLDDIRMVVVSLNVQEPAGQAGMLDRSYETTVICRNLYF